MSSKNWMVPYQRTLKWVAIEPLDTKIECFGSSCVFGVFVLKPEGWYAPYQLRGITKNPAW